MPAKNTRVIKSKTTQANGGIVDMSKWESPEIAYFDGLDLGYKMGSHDAERKFTRWFYAINFMAFVIGGAVSYSMFA